jgi:hypothetical protein
MVACAFGLLLPVSKASAFGLFYDFSFSGTVESAVETDLSGDMYGATKVITAMQGEPYRASFFITQNGPVTTGTATFTGGLPGVFVLVSPPPGTPLQTGPGVSYSNGNASLLSSPPGNFSGSVGSSFPFSFTYHNGNPSADVLTARWPVGAIFRADDSGSFSLTLGVTSASLSVSPVPLPRTLPMFAAALLALGIFGYVGRRREVSARGIRRTGASNLFAGSSGLALHPSHAT